MRSACRIVVALAAIVAGACGGDSPSPLPSATIPTSPSPTPSPSPAPEPSPTPSPTPPPLSLSSVVVVGRMSLREGESAQFASTARYSDGSTKDVTAASAWSSAAPSLATVSATGMVAAVKAGEVEINVRFEDRSGSLRIAVVGTLTVPWSRLPPLSTEGRSFVTSSNLNWTSGGGASGAVKRWNNFPISIRADRSVSSDELEKAVDFWQSLTNGKIRFRMVSSSADADMVLSLQWPPPDNIMVSERTCAVGWPRTVLNNVIVSGAVYIDSVKANCSIESGILAHEIGHALGLLGHTASDTDVMSPALPSPLRASPLLTEVINWLYSVEPGTRPE